MTSSFLKDVNDWDITIPGTRETDKITWFIINVRVGTVKWSLEHRYSQFSNLHKSLISSHGVSKELLPSKVYLMKMTPGVLESRRSGLEVYINSVLRFLSNTMPPVLVSFLEFDKYDTWFLFKPLADNLRTKNYLENPSKKLRTSVIEVCALSKRLKLPCPPVSIIDSQSDFCTVLEYFNTLKGLKIKGEDTEYYSSSNIEYRNVPFELSAFRSLKSLEFSKIHLENFMKADDMRLQITILRANKCNLKVVADVLQSDNIYKSWDQVESSQIWDVLEVLDLRRNKISVIDTGLELMPNVTDFNISFNQISSLNNIGKLQKLRILKISHNCITHLDDENITLPYLNHLDLSNNEIKTIKGVLNFPALKTLNLSFNQIESFDELDFISPLSNIVSVDLIGNPISQKTDYRVKALGMFGKRAYLLVLDNEQCTSHELELIALVKALKFAQDGKQLSYNKNLSLNL